MNAPTAETTDAAVALAAATAAARLLPAAAPLVPAPAPAGARPDPGALAVVASFVGPNSADVVLVADAAVSEALAAGAPDGSPLDLAAALRPALEAAVAELGAGVLEAARTEPVATALPADAHLVALTTDDGVQAWFALRLRTEPTPRTPGVPTQRASLQVLYDVEMTLTAELGRTKLPVRQVLELTPGAVLELDRAAGSPADVMVNGRLIARGEVVVIDEEFGIRITEIARGEDGAL
ncbi:flagellar motor switch protein FliN [Cellulomonas sp. C5510]|uniref:flagellar motor switch protein FliN n=1 Tax=Cellulomonas sp. C5510 TaxID=2871170 RepID=UPI001C9403D3|nr:flagellar motor switch protein FliN [Cellulomonas sp. C5510]QZN86150.1 flagellar motor switch protein FliN [Cellulomonas sp. C5510]